ncbi:MAG: hypothetical protein ACJ8FY_12025 [Gemmataceae bacterium]
MNCSRHQSWPTPLPSGRVLLAATLGLLLSGCGLADYEAKMAEEQARIQRVEEENNNLDEPVVIPPPKKEADKDSKIPDLFFRPPKGIGHTAQKDLYGGLLYVYPRTGSAEGIQDAYIGFSKGRKDFLKDVLKVFPSNPPAKKSVTERTPPGRNLLHFETITIEDTSSTVILHTLPYDDQLLLVGFRVDRKAESNQTAKRMDMSLESLGLGPDAAKLRRQYKPKTASTKSTSPPK